MAVFLSGPTGGEQEHTADAQVARPETLMLS